NSAHFFVHAEDGIRYRSVTGVQTCALPICHYLHDLLSTGQFALFSIIAAVIAIAIAYPFVMTNAHRVATWVMRSVSHEAIITGLAALICVICLYEGGLLALGVTITVGLVGGLFNLTIGMNAGVQFTGYYVAVLPVPALLAL